MRCGRADRVDLDAFLLGAAGDDSLDAFREHYPHCSDCAAAVADWMTLDGALREVMAETGERISLHPEPEDLALFAEAPTRLGERAMQIESHLATCTSCGNELRLIRSFDPSMFGPPSEAMPALAREPSRVEAGYFDGLREALVGLVEKLRGFHLLGPVPALALAVVVLAGLWLSGALDRFSGSRIESREPQLVERSAPERSEPTPIQPPEPNGLIPGVTPGLDDGHEEAIARTPEPPAMPTPMPEAEAERIPDADGRKRTPTPVELAQAERAPTEAVTPPSPSRAPSRTEPGPTTAPEAKPDEVLLAEVSALPPPDYATPAAGESLVWMRQFGAVRSAPSEAHVAARAPRDHTGVTLSSSPRLWWALDKPTDRPVQITIVDGESIDPLVRVELPGPHAAGLHAFDLAEQGARLSPGVDYRWFVSIVVDPDRPSRNPVSAGSLRVAGVSDARRATVSSADASIRGNRFAELGLWYDAFDFYASLAQAHPEVERLATYRDRLAEVSQARP